MTGRLVSAAAVLTAFVIGAVACDPPPSRGPLDSGGSRPSHSPAGVAWQKPMPAPTGLRVLIDGQLVDVDAGTVAPRDVWERLIPVNGPPIFIVRSGTQKVGPAKVERATSVGDLPGAPAILLVTGAYFDIAASIDGRSVWISEYLSQTRCTLRELWLDGRTKRAARTLACGVTPVAQTDAGLWVRQWDNWFTMDHNFDEFSWREPTYALLDPETLTERAAYPEARILGRDHVLTLDDQETNLVLRTPNSAVRLDKPSPYTEYVFNGHRPVAPVSPDGRYVIFRFGSHSQSPQIIDVWVLDLLNAAWLHVPGMPTGGALKYASEAWASDGRLVMVGAYGPAEPILATWRPGEAQIAIRSQNPIPPETFDNGFGPIFAW